MAVDVMADSASKMVPNTTARSANKLMPVDIFPGTKYKYKMLINIGCDTRLEE